MLRKDEGIRKREIPKSIAKNDENCQKSRVDPGESP